MEELHIQFLERRHVDDIIKLTVQLNPHLAKEKLIRRQLEMFDLDHYLCFGLYHREELVGVSSGWITVRLYSGRQLEIDNFIIDTKYQSEGWGTYFLGHLERWAVENGCETVELNAYVGNSRAHKFYYTRGFKILGFHFQKSMKD